MCAAAPPRPRVSSPWSRRECWPSARKIAPSAWWAPGEGTPLPAFATYENDRGPGRRAEHVRQPGHEGASVLRGHRHERARVRHLPSAGRRHGALRCGRMRERWEATGGRDPLFAAVDGMNCPESARRPIRAPTRCCSNAAWSASSLPWPPSRRGRHAHRSGVHHRGRARSERAATRTARTGSPARRPSISVFRRPRPVANTKYTTHQNFGVGAFIAKSGLPTATDPADRPADEHEPDGGRARADAGRAGGRRGEAAPAGADAAHRVADRAHRRLRTSGLRRRRSRVPPPAAWSKPGGPPAFGPRNLAAGDAGVLGNNTTRYVFPMDGTVDAAAAYGQRRRRTRATPRANRSPAGTTCSCSGRSGSGTRCT